MNRLLVILAGVIAVAGLIITVGIDMDNIYDMTISVIWVLTAVLAFAGAFVSGSKHLVGSKNAESENIAGRAIGKE